MLNARSIRRFAPVSAQFERGFNLIELMISIVIGMLVVAGALSLIVAMNTSNATTVESARLTQELRATLQLIADDLRRARRLNDPFREIGKGALTAAQTPPLPYYGPYDTIANPTSDCILYSYQGQETNSTSIDTAARTVSNDRAIYRDATLGTVVLRSNQTAARTGNTAPVASTVTCGTGGTGGTTTTLSSAQIEITQLQFDPPPPPSPLPVPPPAQVSDGIITVTLSGRMRFSSGQNLGVTRTLTQTINVRSPKAG